ncbi:hypothetical protein N7522_007757 [Penicillium canescens]|nr:hypothetical protein N7522_007757 [Penicillium canescens]
MIKNDDKVEYEAQQTSPLQFWSGPDYQLCKFILWEGSFSGACYLPATVDALIVPPEEEYLQVIDRKTGGLFRIATRIMKLHNTENSTLDLSEFVALMGRYFQIRDDYQNLNATEV